MKCIYSIRSGPPSVFTFSCVDLSGDVSGSVSVTVNWTLSDGDSADFYLINITTNAPLTPYGGLLNITTASITQYELTGFMAGYEYNITVRGVNCGGQEGSGSEPLTITPQGRNIVNIIQVVTSNEQPCQFKSHGLTATQANLTGSPLCHVHMPI